MSYDTTKDNVFESNVDISSITINSSVLNSALIGSIEMFWTNSTTAPTNYLWCDGSTINTTTNSDYTTLIQLLANSTTATTCKLPLIENCNIAGMSSSFESYVDKTGTTKGKYTLDNAMLPTHSHNISNTVNNSNTNTTFDLTFNTTSHNTKNNANANYTINNYSGMSISSSYYKDSRSTGKGENANNWNHTHNEPINNPDNRSYITTAQSLYTLTNSHSINKSYNLQTNVTDISGNTFIPYSKGLKFAIRYK
jgi:microcystin-dependent protein